MEAYYIAGLGGAPNGRGPWTEILIFFVGFYHLFLKK